MALRRLIAATTALTMASAGVAAPTSAPSSRLAIFPNTTIEYYDVKGATVSAINQSIRAQRGTSAKGKTLPAATSWAVKADFDREMTGGRCVIRDARVEMTARAELPRLADGDKLTASERARWSDYVGLLEQGSASTLAFVYENLGQVEAAIRRSSCDDARAAAGAAVEVLRAHANRLSTDNEKRLAALSEFRPVMLTNAKVVCRDLKVTGGRLHNVRTCLPAREWERLWKSSAAYTQELGVKFSKSPRDPF